MKIEILFCVVLLFNYVNSSDDFSYPEDKLDALDLWKYNFNSVPVNFDTKTKNSAEEDYKEPVVTDIKRKRSIKDDDEVNLQEYLIETKLCESKIMFTRPRKLQNVNNKLMTIVNHRNYTQFVRFENCLEPHFPCTRNVYPFDIKSFCHQNYHTVRLLAFDQERNCLLEDDFVVPSTCDCMIDKDDLFKGVHKNIIQGN